MTRRSPAKLRFKFKQTKLFTPSPYHLSEPDQIVLEFQLEQHNFFHKGKFAHIDQTRLSPVMICNKLVHFANVFLQVLEGRHIDQTLALLCSNISKQVGTIFPVWTSGTISFCQLDTVGSFQMCCG